MTYARDPSGLNATPVGPAPTAMGLPTAEYPAVLNTLTVLSLNLVGEGLSDALNPRLAGGR